MDEELKLSKLYKQGFNHACMLNQYRPELLKGMTVPTNEPSEYTKGFNDGQKSFDRDLGRDALREAHKTKEEKNKNKDRGYGRE